MKVTTLAGLCDTFLYSASTFSQQEDAKKYLSQRLGHPDEGSQFDRHLGTLKHLFRIPYLGKTFTTAGLYCLMQQGYDALLLQLHQELIGHTAFQVHEDHSLHIFSIEVLTSYRGNGLATYMTEQMFTEARKKGIQRIRVGGGGHETVNAIHQHFLKRQGEFHIKISEDNWVDLL